ncbi:MAG: LCP family protein [Clostridia bacterium]|nr:LCP family protein [Clostridia bacterium]
MDNNTENKVITESTETPAPKKKKKGKLILLIILITIFALLLGAVAYAVYTVKFHTPDTGINEPPPFATDGLKETEDTTAPSEPEETDEPEETQPTDPSQLPKSQQKIYNFLVVGQDRVALNTDVIMIVNFNTTTHKINIMQIPRDTYIELSTYRGKINGLFGHYFMKNGRDKRVALRMFAETLEQNLCIKIHNFVHINLDGVREIVDTIGGVDVNVSAPFTIYGTEGKIIYLSVGLHHLDGYLAERFIRHRATYLQADIARMDAQKIFMSALLKKVKNSFNINTIPKLAEVVYDNTITDVSFTDGVYFAKELLNVNLEEINFMSMLGKSTMTTFDGNGSSVYVMIRKNMVEMIDKYFNIYDFSITDSIFDTNRVFTSTKIYPHINKIYINENTETDDPYSADEIIDNSIDIPHK